MYNILPVVVLQSQIWCLKITKAKLTASPCFYKARKGTNCLTVYCWALTLNGVEKP